MTVMGFPIDLSAFQPVVLDPKQAALTDGQRTQLQAILRHETFPPDFVLAAAREVPSFALLVAEGTVRTALREAGNGEIVPDFEKVARGEPYLDEVRTLTTVTGYSISRRKLNSFLDENPGLALKFRGSRR